VPIPLKTGVTAEVGATTGLPPPVELPVGVDEVVGLAPLPPPNDGPELNEPVEVEGLKPDEGEVKPDVSGAVPASPLEVSVKAGDASEVTCTVPRYRPMICAFGRGRGSWEVTLAGSSEATLLAAASRVVRSIVIRKPFSVREAELPLTASIGLVTAMEMPNSLSRAFSVEIGAASGADFPSAAMPFASTVTGVPAMLMFVIRVEPETEPVEPSEVAFAVEVTAPILMNPPRMEMPESVAVADPDAVFPGAPEVDVLEIPPIPKMDDEDASGLPGPLGAVGVPVPADPAVAAPSPRVAVAVLPLADDDVSMLTPGSSVEAVFGVCG